MRILCRNLKMLKIWCYGSDNTKEQCSCIYAVVPSKMEWLNKISKYNMKDIIGIFIAYWHIHLK